jgi:uncharacterized protein YegP (UPF0339 family)
VPWLAAIQGIFRAKGGHVAHFYINRDQAQEWRWRFRANNEKIIADSGEGYTRQADCEEAVERVKREAPNASVLSES